MAEQRKSGSEAELKRVIEKNRQYLETTREMMHRRYAGNLSGSGASLETVREALELYLDMRARLAEIDAVQQLLVERGQGQPQPGGEREKVIAELDAQIAALSARLAEGGGAPAETAGADGTPADRWLRDGEASVKFTRNARLLGELDYGGADRSTGRREPEKERVQESEGRGFTLFSIRGPAAALDAFHPAIRLDQYDIVERFSATEIRGVLTHLRKISREDLEQLFQRLLSSQFGDVRCVLVALRSPDDINDALLAYIDHLAGTMQQGEIRTIDIS